MILDGGLIASFSNKAFSSLERGRTAGTGWAGTQQLGSVCGSSSSRPALQPPQHTLGCLSFFFPPLWSIPRCEQSEIGPASPLAATDLLA